MNVSEGVAELIGVILGDGHIYRKNKKYRVGVTGNLVTDKEYFEYLKELIQKEWNKEASISVLPGRLRMMIHSKEVCNFLIDEVKIPHGEGKCVKIFIPDFIVRDWNLARRTIRGLIDTDGTVFVSRKPRVDKYPSIELTTTSIILVEQVKKILIGRGFRLNKIRRVPSKRGKRKCYRVALNGKPSLKKWIDEIGFSNPWKLNRAISYLK